MNAWIRDSKPDKEKELVEQTAEATGWKARIELIDLQNNSITCDNNAVERGDGFDYNHMDIKEFNFSSSQNNLNGMNFNTQINSCSPVANNKYSLKGFHTHASYSDSALLIKDLEIGFNQSALRTEGVRFPIAGLLKGATFIDAGNF